jgi:hypothetical protein
MEAAEGVKPEVVGFLRQSNLRGCDRFQQISAIRCRDVLNGVL